MVHEEMIEPPKPPQRLFDHVRDVFFLRCVSGDPMALYTTRSELRHGLVDVSLLAAGDHHLCTSCAATVRRSEPNPVSTTCDES